jgi:hypothetical protein
MVLPQSFMVLPQSVMVLCLSFLVGLWQPSPPTDRHPAALPAGQGGLKLSSPLPPSEGADSTSWLAAQPNCYPPELLPVMSCPVLLLSLFPSHPPGAASSDLTTTAPSLGTVLGLATSGRLCCSWQPCVWPSCCSASCFAGCWWRST